MNGTLSERMKKIKEYNPELFNSIIICSILNKELPNKDKILLCQIMKNI